MKTARGQPSSRPGSSRRSRRRPGGTAKAGELAELRSRLAETDETLRAIRAGEVDTIMVEGKQGPQVFTLKGADHAYRVLIEAMNEGALTLTADATILYANQCFARMVKCPLEQVTGNSFGRFLSAADQATIRPLLRPAHRAGSKIQVLLKTGDGSATPVQISIRSLAANGFKHASFGLVVTDLTEARRIEGLLRALTHRVVQAQEAEQGRVALELHDNITQLLCGVLFRSQALADSLAGRAGPAKREAVKLREMLAQTAGEVERISRNLRPSALDQLGLVEVLRDTSAEFAQRTGLSVKLAGVALVGRLPDDIELTLYRILQEALRNVERHACAHYVTVCLGREGAVVQLTIADDGIGFDAAHHAARRKEKGVLGLLGMQERAASVGGALTVKSGRRAGTKIEVRIPLPAAVAAAD
jgi:signal transduction histidine kinase